MASSNQTKLKAMTNQHPLTDEKVSGLIQPICEWAYEASMPEYDRILYGSAFDMESDRAAITEEIEIATKIVRDTYDLGRDAQLEQVIEWLKDHLDAMSYVWADDVTAWGIDVESVIVDLKKAMRPTTTATTEGNS